MPKEVVRPSSKEFDINDVGDMITYLERVSSDIAAISNHFDAMVEKLDKEYKTLAEKWYYEGKCLHPKRYQKEINMKYVPDDYRSWDVQCGICGKILDHITQDDTQ